MEPSQVSTTPVIVESSKQITSSPSTKPEEVRLTLNVGKCFSGMILPADFNLLNVPGDSPVSRNSDRLNAIVPIPPRFASTAVRVKSL